MSVSSEPVVRIVRGELDDGALAALTTVLLARVSASRSEPDGRCQDFDHGPRAGWRRTDRGIGYRSPGSWCRM